MALKEYAAAGGIVIADGQMLLLDRPRRNEIRLPKGHIESGESPETTALREVVEETGYAEPEIVRGLGSQLVEFVYQGDEYRRTEHYFLMVLRSDRRSSQPAKDAADFSPMWVPLEKAVAALTYEAEQNMARKAITALRDTHNSSTK